MIKPFRWFTCGKGLGDEKATQDLEKE